MSETARGHLGRVQNGPGVHRQRPKQPEGTSGVFEMAEGAYGASQRARGHLGSVRNGPGMPRKRPKRP